MSEERGAEKEIVVGMSPKSRRAVLVKAADAPKQKSAADEISPALRMLLLAIRSAAYAVGDAIGDYLCVKRRWRD